MATHSSILAWGIPGTEEPGGPFNIFGPQLTEVTEEESKTTDKDGGLVYK